MPGSRLRSFRASADASPRHQSSTSLPRRRIVEVRACVRGRKCAPQRCFDRAGFATDPHATRPTMASGAGRGLIDAGEDDRINDASWENGVLYLSQPTNRCSYPGDPYLETCARIMEISTTGAGADVNRRETTSGSQTGMPTTQRFRPEPKTATWFVVRRYSNPNSYPSIAATAAIGPRSSASKAGPSSSLRSSPAAPVRPSQRWGDYSGGGDRSDQPFRLSGRPGQDSYNKYD